MNRYLTIEHYDGKMKVLTESDDYQAALNNDAVADWVWQFAESKQDAIYQHASKVDQWQANPNKTTY